ncbi:MAG TPA: hypothetical protein VIV11_23800 [Kofleriaceae bacterium]
MKTTEKTAATTEETVPSIDTIELDEVTGGCAACGQPGHTPTAGAGTNKTGQLGGLFGNLFGRG